MKKLFLVLAVASLGFVACNNEGETKETTDTTTVTAPVEPTPAPDTTAPVVVDTTVKADSAK